MRRAAALLLSICVLSGCAKEETTPVAEGDVLGFWTSDLMSEVEEMPQFAEIKDKLTPVLELMPDRTYELQVFLMPVRGEWTLEGRDVALSPKTWGDLTMEEMKAQMANQPPMPFGPVDVEEMAMKMTLRLSADGKTLKQLQGGAWRQTFTRAEGRIPALALPQ
jgi:hypothetical protein